MKSQLQTQAQTLKEEDALLQVQDHLLLLFVPQSHITKHSFVSHTPNL
jgi:hypothetical protein